MVSQEYNFNFMCGCPNELTPPSTCVHLILTPLLLRVDVINGWPLSLTFPQETVIFPAAFVRTMVADFEAIFSMSCFFYMELMSKCLQLQQHAFFDCLKPPGKPVDKTGIRCYSCPTTAGKSNKRFLLPLCLMVTLAPPCVVIFCGNVR